MSDAIKKWLDATPWREGIFAFGIRNPDRSVLTKTRVKPFAAETLENALQSTGDLFQNLERNHLNFGRACLVYKNALIHAERRLDGICLIIFTSRDEKTYDADGMEKTFSEFRKLAVET